MIITAEELGAAAPEFSGADGTALQRQLDALEAMVRGRTHNGFQNRGARFYAASSGGVLAGTSPYLALGDTVQITDSVINDGLYTVKTLGEDTALDRTLFDDAYNLVTKVEYPADVVEGVIALMRYRKAMDGKEWLASESLGRHSVSFDTKRTAGYPSDMLAFLDPYMKARF